MIERLRFRNCPQAKMIDIAGWNIARRYCGNLLDVDCNKINKRAQKLKEKNKKS